MTTEDIVYLDETTVVDEHAAAPHGEPCEACGAPVEPGDKFCPHCGAPAAAAPVAEVAAAPKKYIQCNTCGAHITTDLDQRSYTCPFCDSKYVQEYTQEQTGRQPPEFVIGFAVTPEQAMEKFRTWITSNSLFRPGDLETALADDKMRGVYLPFWRFTMLATSRWSARIGEYWYRTETYTTTDSKGNRVTRTRRVQETEWWPLSGGHHMYHRDYLVSGSKGLPQKEALRINPFNLPALKRYNSTFIAGWVTEEYSIEREQAQAICEQEFHRREEAAIKAFLPGDTHSDLRVMTNFSHKTSDLCLLPMYLLSYRYRDKVFRFLVNGQTGKIAGDKPWSWKRITSAVVVSLVLLAIIIIFLLVIAGILGSR
jgi:hypothetical protein